MESSQDGERKKIQEYEDMINKYAGNLPETAEGQPAGTAIKNPDSYGENAQATADGAGKIFAKPIGAIYEGGTVDTGIVVTIKGSQFVWVPVDDVVLDESKETELPINSSNKSNGKAYTPMAVKVGNDYKGILYSGDTNYVMYNNKSNRYQGSSTEFREPDVVASDSGEYKSEGITVDTLTKEYNAMIESVKKYKGFYVAQYEAGLDLNNNIVFKNASKDNSITTADAGNNQTLRWYGLYKKIGMFAKADNNEDKVVSSMIWGSQYDAMINWMTKTGNSVKTDNSKVYNNTNITGNKSTDIVNNVYDLYGCHYEWTLEAYNSSYRAWRGGYLENDKSPAYRNNDISTNDNLCFSSRATLYVK